MNIYHTLRLDTLDYLRQFSGRELLYYPNPGNAGDSLIQTGTYAAFRTAGVNCRTIDINADVHNRIVILGGGGNYVKLYENIRNAIDKFRLAASKIIILPHTIRDNESHISSLDEKFAIFCREAVSYDHVSRLNNKSEVYLGHDMAFHLNGQEFLSDPANKNIADTFFQNRIREHNIAPEQIYGLKIADFRRVDWESVHSHPTSFADISEIFKVGTGPSEAVIGSWCMLKAVSLVDSIVTDRLHVGIAACLMDKPCCLYDNSYKKVSAVYHHSIRNRFPQVRLESDLN